MVRLEGCEGERLNWVVILFYCIGSVKMSLLKRKHKNVYGINRVVFLLIVHFPFLNCNRYHILCIYNSIFGATVSTQGSQCKALNAIDEAPLSVFHLSIETAPIMCGSGGNKG